MCFCGKGCYVEENNKLQKNKCERPVDYHVSSPDYRGMIIETINKVDNQGALEYLHTFIKLYIEKWG